MIQPQRAALLAIAVLLAGCRKSPTMPMESPTPVPAPDVHATPAIESHVSLTRTFGTPGSELASPPDRGARP